MPASKGVEYYQDLFEKTPRFGLLTAIEHAGNNSYGQLQWKFLCDCGSDYLGPVTKVCKSVFKSCGCTKRLKDLTGKKFGRLTAMHVLEISPGRKQRYWRCVCECGKEHDVRGRALRSGTVQSCGCMINGASSAAWKGTGQLSGTRWHLIVEGTKRRSRTIPLSITKEDAWALFQDQAGRCALSGQEISLGARSRGTASLDRIDSNKGYHAGNVQWVHKDLNCMKGALQEDMFLEFCRLIAKNNALPVAQ